MTERDSRAPWNPKKPTEVTPEEYERAVLNWLMDAGPQLGDARLSHRDLVRGAGGEYEIDVVLEFPALGGALLRVLVECKRHRRPVERDQVLALAMKVQDTGSHKGIMFSTAGYQSGALEFASSKGIATVTFIDGRATYETKARGPAREPPPWISFPKYAGYFLEYLGNGARSSLVSEEHLETLAEWLRHAAPRP